MISKVLFGIIFTFLEKMFKCLYLILVLHLLKQIIEIEIFDVKIFSSVYILRLFARAQARKINLIQQVYKLKNYLISLSLELYAITIFLKPDSQARKLAS